ncbi:ABC transporter permease [Thermogemmatispora tikiterensis]|uniref:MacB-like periplasmic core domain-containing protein n=1 Tax=Thermogemmatispora tikiterensis TaxID=1825093 RepID=A0A328V9H7_9CHLR|nr:ABC transporter permease [Thermogemmatispora tikiterensis]RAQ94306.1 hypothetical protein A4R35_02100 [Thermogemmatispora tikiterensis]
MKASMYVKYATRSLVRGGQRTLLALCCIAVGVMTIVSLQLVGFMLNNAFTGNVRDSNGGDIAVTSQSRPFTQQDLTFFAQLQRAGTITGYTPRSSFLGSASLAVSSTEYFTVEVVDPATFPLVRGPDFISPANGQLRALLGGGQVVIDQALADQ